MSAASKWRAVSLQFYRDRPIAMPERFDFRKPRRNQRGLNAIVVDPQLDRARHTLRVRLLLVARKNPISIRIDVVHDGVSDGDARRHVELDLNAIHGDADTR